MASFLYRAYDSNGAVQEGKIEANVETSAREKLKEDGLIPVEIKLVADQAHFSSVFFHWDRKPNLAELELLTSKIALLLKNGIKIDKVFQLIQKGIKNKQLLKAIETISSDVRGGMALSKALENYPGIFDQLFISVVAIGEATGNLAKSFEGIAENLQFRRQVSAKTREALIYPTIILFVCVVSIFFIMNFIVPRFYQLFDGVENIPVYTSIMFFVSDVIRQYQLPALFSLPLLVLLVKFRHHDRLKRVLNVFTLKAPLVKDLCLLVENLRFTSSLAILLRNGVLISEALEYAVASIGNSVLRKKMMKVKDEVRRGNKLSECMEKTGFLPDEFEGLLEVGEQTGSLAEIFAEMETRLRIIYENRVSMVINILEPLMIIVLGLLVGGVVIGMLLSMIAINDIGF